MVEQWLIFISLIKAGKEFMLKTAQCTVMMLPCLIKLVVMPLLHFEHFPFDFSALDNRA